MLINAGMPSTEEFFSAAAYCRDCLNPYLFVYGFSVALIHRPDTRNVELPRLSEIFPARFVDGGVFTAAREQAHILFDEGTRVRKLNILSTTENLIVFQTRIAQNNYLLIVDCIAY